MIQSNIQAINEFETTKSLSIKDLKVIKPLTQPQKQMFESYFYGNFVLATGASGTGKTLISIYLGLNDVLSKSSKQNQLIIVRSAVPSREIGYLPGTEIEKLESYEIPYRDIFTYLFNRKTAYDKMKKQNIVRFIPTSFIRGLTWDNAVIIIDEIQNMTFYELNSVITRVGANSKLIIIGDQMQSDLYRNKNDKSGMKDFLIVANKVEEFDHITFTKNDILRSSFVKSWICALEDSNISN
jgi:phosphate starvation-inducible protein PhoH